MVPYFEVGHFLTPLALGMVPILVIFFFVKKTGPNRAFIGALVRGRPAGRAGLKIIFTVDPECCYLLTATFGCNKRDYYK